MNLDALAKRHFYFIVAALIALAAYLQASGLASALSEALTPPKSLRRPRAPHPRTPLSEQDEHARSASAILSRNPFDSVTGPLDVPQANPGGSREPLAQDRDSHDDPPCDTGRVTLIIEAVDPKESFAAIDAPGTRPLLLHEGDEFGGRTVRAIGWDRVWLSSDASTRCQMVLGAKPKEAPPPVKPPGNRRHRGALPPELAERIHKVSETEYAVDRSVIAEVLERQAELVGRTRIMPAMEGGKVTGYRLQRVAADSLLGTLGLKNGDELRSINGFSLNDPQKALEAYTKLREAGHLALEIQRAGAPVTIEIHIR